MVNIRNSLENINKKEEVIRRNKDKKTKLTYSMSKQTLNEPMSSYSRYMSLAKPSTNISVSGVQHSVNLSSISLLPPLVNPLVGQAVTSRAKAKIMFPNKDKTFSAIPQSLVELRSEASKELQKSMVQASRPEKGKLPPIRIGCKVVKLKKKQRTHLEIINAIQDIKEDELSDYFYCKKGKDFYAFIEDEFTNIDPKKDDYLTISTRVSHFIILFIGSYALY